MDLEKNMRATFFLLLALFSWAPETLALDQVTTELSKARSGELLQSTFWYDGDQRRTVWINPELWAEFGADTSEKNYLRQKSAGARVRYNFHSIRIWEMQGQQISGKLANHAKSSDPAELSVISPVLHETSSGSSRMRALPGNMIVYLDPALNQSEVSQWIESQGLEVIKMLGVRSNVYVFKTGPGMDALLTANALYESEDVVAAFPDWWVQSEMR